MTSILDIERWISELEDPDPRAREEFPSPAKKRRRILHQISHNHSSCLQPLPSLNTDYITNDQPIQCRRGGVEEGRRTRSGVRLTPTCAALPLRGQAMVTMVEERIEYGRAYEDRAQYTPQTSSIVSDLDSISNAPSLPARASSISNRSPSRSSSPSKRSRKAPATVTKRGDLALMKPRIEFRAFEDAEDLGLTLPQSIKDLWMRCEDRRNPRSTAPPFRLTGQDQQLVDAALTDAFEMAKIWRSSTTEAHWISVVVGPILHLLRRLSPFRSKDKTTNENLTVLDITTVEISPSELCPYSNEPDLFRDLNKNIDYAVGLSLARHHVRDLQDATYNAGVKSINQTSTFANFTPLFLNVEVKKRHVDRDPAIQLAAWVTAEFNKRLLEDYPLDMPVLAIEVETDGWLLHVVCAQENQKRPGDFNLIFLGPLRIGETYSLPDTYRLLDNLCDMALWGQTVYREWFEKNVLAKYEG